MGKMSKLFLVSVVFVTLFLITACGGAGTEETPTPDLRTMTLWFPNKAPDGSSITTEDINSLEIPEVVIFPCFEGISYVKITIRLFDTESSYPLEQDSQHDDYFFYPESEEGNFLPDFTYPESREVPGSSVVDIDKECIRDGLDQLPCQPSICIDPSKGSGVVVLSGGTTTRVILETPTPYPDPTP